MSKLEKNLSLSGDINNCMDFKRFHIIVYDDDTLKWASVVKAQSPKDGVINEMLKYDPNYDYDVEEWNIEVFEGDDNEDLYSGYGDIKEYKMSEYLLKTKIPVYKTSIIKHKGGDVRFINEDFSQDDKFV